MGDTIYLDKGLNRRKQIYTWFIEVTEGSMFFGNKMREIQLEIMSGNIDRATSIFKIVMDQFIISSDDQTLTYIIQDNVDKFGKGKVYKDLFIGIFGSTLRREKIRKQQISRQQISRTRATDLETIKKRIKPKKPKRVFGVDSKTSKRREAKVITVIVGNTTQFRLRDKKTGRFLGYTKSFKKRIEKR